MFAAASSNNGCTSKIKPSTRYCISYLSVWLDFLILQIWYPKFDGAFMKLPSSIVSMHDIWSPFYLEPNPSFVLHKKQTYSQFKTDSFRQKNFPLELKHKSLPHNFKSVFHHSFSVNNSGNYDSVVESPLPILPSMKTTIVVRSKGSFTLRDSGSVLF